MNFKVGQPMRPHEGRHLQHEPGRRLTTGVRNFSLPRAGDPPQFSISFIGVSSNVGPLDVMADGIG
jgi:hypothetical protein